MKKLVLGAAFAMCLGVFGPALANCENGEAVIKFSHVVASEGHPKGELAQTLADRINSEMDGLACMEVYPSSQLYDDSEVMEALLLGEVQLAAPSLAKFELYTLKYRVFGLPFLFSDMEAVDAFAGGETGQKLLGAMSDYGFVGLGYIYNGLKQFTANRPLVLPSDVKDLVFRVQTSDVAVAMIEAMGAEAKRLPFREVYSALQTGDVDGQENIWSNIHTQRFFAVQDGITETNHQVLAYLAVTSREWLASLDNDVRRQFLMIFRQVSEQFNARSMEINLQNKQAVINKGGVVRTLTPDQRRLWIEAMKPVWDRFRDGIGQDVIEAAIAANDAS